MADFNQSPIGQESQRLATVVPVQLDDLEDVILTDPQLNDRLVYDGTVWRNEAV